MKLHVQKYFFQLYIMVFSIFSFVFTITLAVYIIPCQLPSSLMRPRPQFENFTGKGFSWNKVPHKNFSVFLPWRTCNNTSNLNVNKCLYVYTLSFFFRGGTVVWIQGLTIAMKALYQLCQSASPFCAKNFWNRVLRSIYPCRIWISILLFYISWAAGLTGMRHGLWTSMPF
jgi:hypothetical protein